MTVVCSLNSLVRLLPRDIIINNVIGFALSEGGGVGWGGRGGEQCPTCPVYPELECSFLSFKLHIQKQNKQKTYIYSFIYG